MQRKQTHEKIGTNEWNDLMGAVTDLATSKKVAIKYTVPSQTNCIKDGKKWVKTKDGIETNQVKNVLGAINQLEESFNMNCCQENCCQIQVCQSCQGQCSNCSQCRSRQCGTVQCRDCSQCSHRDCDYNCNCRRNCHSNSSDRPIVCNCTTINRDANCNCEHYDYNTQADYDAALNFEKERRREWQRNHHHDPGCGSHGR